MPQCSVLLVVRFCAICPVHHHTTLVQFSLTDWLGLTIPFVSDNTFHCTNTNGPGPRTMAKKIKQTPSTQISVIAEGKDEWGRRYLLLGERGRAISFPPILASRLISKKTEVVAELVNAGFNLFTESASKEFIASVQKWKGEPSFRVATRIGWNNDTYVLPDKVFNPDQNVYRALGEEQAGTLAKYRVSQSTLEDWQKKIGKGCLNNSRLMFAVALAFTGPILRFVSGERSGGFQIYGDPETGKTTAAMVAGSVWGRHRQPDRGFLESWNTTASAVEVTALVHNDALLILDETKKAGNTNQKRIETVLEVTFRLAEQVEKKRLTGARENRSWRCYFLSTSNFSLDEMGAKGGKEIDDADRGRLVDIPLPNSGHGIYEDLHGLPSGSRLTSYLKGQCRRHYGVPIRQFLSRLSARIRRGNTRALTVGLQGLRHQYIEHLKEHVGAIQPLGRASNMFATVYAAGALAIRLGVLDWKKSALGNAVLSCQLDGLEEPRDTKAAATASAMNKKSMREMDKKLVDFLRRNEANSMDLRRKYADPKTHKFRSVPYYIANHKGHKYWYLTADALKSIIGPGPEASRYKQSLLDRGYLDVSTGGKTGRRFVVERRIFAGKGKEGMEWVHAIKRPIKISA
jgi:putative DNA primase/helicase